MAVLNPRFDASKATFFSPHQNGLPEETMREYKKKKRKSRDKPKQAGGFQG